MSQERKVEMFQLACELLDSTQTVWKMKRVKEKISSTHKSYGTVYKVHTQFPISAAELTQKILNLNKNPMILEATQLGMVDEQTDIIRVITAPSACGLIKSKEFINLRSWKKDGESFLIVAKSLDSQNLTENNEIMVWVINAETSTTSTMEFMMCFQFKVPGVNVAYLFFKTYLKHIRREMR